MKIRPSYSPVGRHRIVKTEITENTEDLDTLRSVQRNDNNRVTEFDLVTEHKPTDNANILDTAHDDVINDSKNSDSFIPTKSKQ